ncbi:hypothetical protein Daus18300_006847 [Diaporthe australafricana]|uniref:Heterokaryon incompatibility domain-containing protein n=1 Tax=Diaporthe australafricana TaxID=127596 RepID=A0ABR3WRL1_9PEZI
MKRCQFCDGLSIFNLLPRIKLTATPGLEDKAVKIGKYRLGSLPVDPYTGSKTNFELARKWLDTCQQQHDHCLSGRLPSLPTRVIDVGTDAAYQKARLKVNTQGVKAEYVALSHCWGGKIATMLTKDNLEMYSMDGIPLEKLPANFQDAIKVTQELGIRYLWIDSLCILQGQDADAIADWERESKAMTIVYRDCTLTISALASEKSTDGFLTYKTDVGESAEETSAWIRVLPVTFGDSIQAEVRRFDPKREESLVELETKGPLALRGWTLQENVLSPRHLFYGANLIHWACPSGYKSANGMLGNLDQKYPDLSPILFDGILRQKSQALECDKERIFQSYYDLVERFSARKLTCPSDKLPAFSGIAQRLQSILGDYLAGIWRDSFARGLLWWVKEGEDDSACPASEYRAPSWSWASMDGALSYSHLGRLQPECSLDAHYIDHNIHLVDPTNPFGQIKEGASLTLKGLTMRAVRPLPYRDGEDFDLSDVRFDKNPSCGNCREDREQSQELSSMLKPDSDTPKHYSNVAGAGHPSKIELGGYRVNPGQYLILVLRARPSELGLNIRDQKTISCLVLESEPGLHHDSEVFKRVGALEGYVPLAKLRKWEKRTLVLV